MKRKRGFTLLELLVVIGIIGILAGLLFPAISAAKRKSTTMRAAAEAQAIVIAWHEFYNDTGMFPLLDPNDVSYGADPSADQPNHWLMNVLRSVEDGEGNYRAAFPNHPFNYRRKVYLEARTESLDADGNLIDPWKQQYEITVDCTLDRVCEGVGDYGSVTNTKIVVWSRGPDGKPYTDDDVKTWH